ncbi:MAG: hypothetical protein JWO51_3948 [Rhodospirillales bacterium]|jgi:hypothetical protein|nr:hypothetical protein [Rhodospirillales bacterium]
MSIGGISSSSYTSQTSSSDATSAGNDPLAQLLKAIKSGNLSAAKAAYQNILDNAPGQNSSSSTSGTSSSSTSSSGNPLQNLLTQLGTALSSGDLSSAQSLVKSFEANKHKHSQGAGSAPPSDGTGGNQALGSAVGGLLSSVQSGDLSSAQSAYATVASLLGGNSSSSSTSSSASASSTSSSSSSGENPLLTLINSIGTSLSNNDLAGAQSTLSSFAPNAQSGLAYNNHV